MKDRASFFAAFVVPLTLGLFYFGAYAALSCHSTYRGRGAIFFEYEWQADLFEPAAKVESLITGHKVENHYRGEPTQ